MHLQPVFAALPRARDGAVATDLFERGLCLPSGSNLSDRDLGRVVETIRSVGARRGRLAALQPKTKPRPSGNGQSSRRSQEAA